MNKRFGCFFIIAFLLACNLLAGCSIKEEYCSIESTSEQAMEHIPEESEKIDSSEIFPSLDATQTPSCFEPEPLGEIDFRYIYRGFTAVPANDSKMLKRFMEFDEQTITTEEQWSAFMAFYCPGIPYDKLWDFSEDYLIAFIAEAANPEYTNSNAITKLIWGDGRFIPEYGNNPDDFVYAINSKEYTHFFVDVIAVSKEQQSPAQKKTVYEPISGDFKTVYRGFEIVSLDDRETFERFCGFGTKAIATEDDWNGFKNTFCSGIPTDEPVDFTGHSLIVSVVMGARPTYAVANKILGVDTEYGCPVFEDSATNCVHALNTENYTHFYIAVIALPREQIADNLEVWTN